MRQQFICTACGLRLTGKVRTDKIHGGEIVANDRAATEQPPEPLPCLCAECAAK